MDESFPPIIEDRIHRYHAPYHAAIAERIAAARRAGTVPILVSMHSFTPRWRGHARPWHIGILWDRDGRLALPLLEQLRHEADILVGDNEPYSGALENDALYRHGTMNGLPHVLIEVRQDLIADDAGVARWASRLELALRDAIQAMGAPAIRFTRPLAASSGGLVMDEKTRTELEAAAFRRLVAHLRTRTDVQNIDMMNLAGFCRNCLGDWYREAASRWKRIKRAKSSMAWRRPNGKSAIRRTLVPTHRRHLQRARRLTAKRAQPHCQHTVFALDCGQHRTLEHRMAKSGFAAGQLKSLIERVERLEEEKAALTADIREVYAEAKGNGFDTKIMRQVVRIRRLDRAERQEQEAILDLYLSALGMRN